MTPRETDPLDDELDKTPFQRVIDDLTNGCGCACHTGTGYRSACEHCQGSAAAPKEEPR